MPGRRPLLAGLVAGTALAMLSPFAAAQGGQWPERAIRVIVPFPPSGATDLVARVVAQKVSQELGQSLVIDNRPGAPMAIPCCSPPAAPTRSRRT
jgi:tripartite-type tricarboxylate transporter receptor subunit TctC